jgi:hypothetical protein
MCASPEKALADIVYFTAGLDSERAVRDFLQGDMRIDEDALSGLDADAFAHIAEGAATRSLKICGRLIREGAG